MGEGEESQDNKLHRNRASGPKADKKKRKQRHDDDPSGQRNPKAFTFHSAVKAARSARRTLDIETKKMHQPLVDRTPLEPPPIVVAIVGPPKVGKTTLLNSLIKNFTRQQVSHIQGPVTVVSG